MSRNLRILLPVAVLIGALLAYWMLLLGPKREEATQLGDAVAAKQAELQTAQQNLAAYRKAKENYAANFKSVTRLGKAVPEDDDVRSLVVQVDSAAKRSSVDFRKITTGENGSSEATANGTAQLPPGATAAGSASFATMPFKLSFSGRFADLATLFSRIERFVTVRQSGVRVSGRLLQLQTISLVSSVAAYPRVRAEVDATTFLLPEQQGLTAGASSSAPSGTTGTGSGTSASATATPAPTTSAAQGRQVG
jgi:Tfp pilus assembly protein PilO